MVANRKLVIGQIKRGFAPFFAFELGLADLAPGFAPLKEVLEGGGNIFEFPFNSTFRGLIGPRKLIPTDGVELLFELFCIRVSACLVLCFPFSKRPVERKAGSASCASKIVGLLRRRMQPYLVRFD